MREAGEVLAWFAVVVIIIGVTAFAVEPLHFGEWLHNAVQAVRLAFK